MKTADSIKRPNYLRQMLAAHGVPGCERTRRKIREWRKRDAQKKQAANRRPLKLW